MPSSRLSLLLVCVVIAGCTSNESSAGKDATDGTVASFVVPPFNEGERALYRGADGGEVAFVVGHRERIHDAERRPIDAVAIHVLLHLPADRSRVSPMTEFLDEDWRKVVVAAPCMSVGGGYGRPDAQGRVCTADKLSASYAESGLPGILGSSGFVGKRMQPVGDIQLAYTLFGVERNVTYRSEPAGSDGCVKAATSFEMPDLRGQRFAGAADLATGVTMCPDSAFPRQIETRFASYQRVEHRPGTVAAAPSGVSVNVWALPPSAAAREERSLGFPSRTYEPTGDSVVAAIEALLATEKGRAFSANQGDVVLYSTIASGFRAPDGFGLGLDTIDIMRDVELLGAKGRVLEGTVRTQCQLRECKRDAEVTAERNSVGFPFLSFDPLSVPVGPMMAIANRTLGGPVTMMSGGIAYPDFQKSGLGRGDEYIYRLRADPEGGFGEPPLFAFRGANGAPLIVSGKAANVTAFTGITRDMLEHPAA